MKPETLHTLRRIIMRSIIVQPVIIGIITPYYFLVLNFTFEKWFLWLWSSQPVNIIAINFSVFAFIEVIGKNRVIKKLIY